MVAALKSNRLAVTLPCRESSRERCYASAAFWASAALAVLEGNRICVLNRAAHTWRCLAEAGLAALRESGCLCAVRASGMTNTWRRPDVMICAARYLDVPAKSVLAVQA